MLFVENKYQIVSGDEERVAIDHINVVTQTGEAKHSLCMKMKYIYLMKKEIIY